MKVGDVIPLTSRNVPIERDGVPVVDCRYGVRNGQYA
jgi:flagellar motor switch protein FliM